jgi:DNA replication initiation complex subunit (GINS family)
MYKKLIEIWLNEKKSKELQEISQSFLEELRNYLEKLKEYKESLRKLN